MKKLPVILLMMAILLSACQSANEPVATSTPIPEPTATAIPTKEAVSDTEKAEISNVYQLSLIIHVDAVLIEEIFNGVQSGTMDDMNAYNNVLSAITVINAIDEQIPLVTPPDCISLDWEQMITYQNASKEILTAWSNDEMDIDDVVTEAQAISTSTTDIMIHIEEQLATTYGMDETNLRNLREETVTQMTAELNATNTEAQSD
jgi:hypothetical protein